VAQLFVAYRIHGPSIHVAEVPVPALRVQPEYLDEGHSGTMLAGCSGAVSKRVYMVLFRLVHVLFPTLDRWTSSIEQGLIKSPLVLEVDSELGDAVFSLAEVSGVRVDNKVLVKPNFLLGCLEAIQVESEALSHRSHRSGQSNRSDSSADCVACLKTVRHLDDVLAIVQGLGPLMAISRHCRPQRGWVAFHFSLP
jgi:hypothetical protein